MARRPHEMDDRWILGWRGLVVTAVEPAAEGFVVRLGVTASLTLVHDSRATVADSLTGVRLAATLPRLRTLVGLAVLSGVAFKDGTLRLILDAGRRLDVVPGATGAGWTACGSGVTWRSTGGALAAGFES